LVRHGANERRQESIYVPFVAAHYWVRSASGRPIQVAAKMGCQVSDSAAILTSKNSEVVRLMQAIELSDKKLQPFRETRKEFMRHIAGTMYGGVEVLEEQQTINLLYSVASILEPALSVRVLKADVVCRKQRVRYFGDEFRLALNEKMRAVGAADALRTAIRDSLTSVGILNQGHDSEGESYVNAISLDDYVVDRRAKDHRPGSYGHEGHFFRMDYDEAMDGGMFTASGREVITTLKGQRRQNQAREISGQEGTEQDEFNPQIELFEAFLPDRKAKVWLPGTMVETKEYLREFEWDGEEDSPYRLLGYSWLSDNFMPIPVIGVIFKLYTFINSIAEKAGLQALAQKDVILASKSSAQDATTIKDIPGNNIALVDNPKDAQKFSLGGSNDTNYKAIGWMNDWVTRLSGNTDMIGGLGAQSNTLGQDQLLMSQAGVRIGDMQAAVKELADWIVRGQGRELWSDPTFRFEGMNKLPGGIELPVVWEPGERVGKFEDYELSASISTTARDTPEQRYAKIERLLNNTMIPMAPLAAQYGSRINLDTVVNVLGRAADIPEIEDLWIEGPPIESPSTVTSPGMAAPGGGGAPGPQGMRNSPGGQRPAVIENMAVNSGGAV